MEEKDKNIDRSEVLVYPWAFGLALGWQELRAANGLADLLKQAAIYAFLGAICWGFSHAVVNMTPGNDGTPKRASQVLMLLGISAAIILL